MNKSDIVNYLNEHTTGKKAGRKDYSASDIFISTTDNDNHFRLSAYGNQAMKKCFDYYEIKLKNRNRRETGYEVLTIDKYMRTPYYFTSSMFVVYEEIIAAELMLLDGDFDLWLRGKS